MSETNVKLAPVVDATFKLEWELTEEDFDNCEFPNEIFSPTYVVQIGSEKSEWVMFMFPKGIDLHKNIVGIGLELITDEKEYKELCAFAVKTDTGYWPEDFAEHLNKRYSDDIAFENYGAGKKGLLYMMNTTEEFKKKFVDGKMTVVAHLVLSMESENGPSAIETANDFIDNFENILALENLSDFTIICQETPFSCHKVLLAASSEYFEALFRNNENKTETRLDETTPRILEATLNFMSKGVIPSDIDDKAMDYVKLADMLGLNLLKNACDIGLVKNLSLENVLETFDIVDKHVRKDEVKQKILAFIKKEALNIIGTNDWRLFVQNHPDLVTEIVISLATK